MAPVLQNRSVDARTIEHLSDLIADAGKELNASQTSLAELTKDVESMQEELRNRRQIATTAFQNFDQKASNYTICCPT